MICSILLLNIYAVGTINGISQTTLTMIVVGNVQPQQVYALAEKHFASMKLEI